MIQIGTGVGAEISLDPAEIVRQEYEACTRAFVATSRNRLAKHLTTVTGLTHREAMDVVDRYCEETHLPVPEYLGREFAVGYLKALSLAMVPVIIALCLYGRNLHLQHINPYGIWVTAVIVGGLAVLFWLKSLEQEAKNAKLDSQSLKEVHAPRAPYSESSTYGDEF